MNLPPHFWAKVDKTETCWNWTGYKSPDGYGRFKGIDPRLVGGSAMSHRVSYEALVGRIPDGLEVDHLCNNRACVNPAHLEPVTHAENSRRTWARKTHCPSGHPYTPENRVPTQSGTRCLICRRTTNKRLMRARRLRLKDAAA